MKMLYANQENINWENFSGNPNADAVRYLRYFPRRIDWVELSANPEAIELLKENPEKVRSMGTLFGRKNLLKKVNAEITYLHSL